MKTIVSLFLLAFLIQNSLSSSDLSVTITGIDKEQTFGCILDDKILGPVFVFYLKIKQTGFPDLKNGTEWKIRLYRPYNYAYATCYIYANDGSEQSTACTVNVLIFPFLSISFPPSYSHYDQSYGWTVKGWEVLAKESIYKGLAFQNIYIVLILTQILALAKKLFAIPNIIKSLFMVVSEK